MTVSSTTPPRPSIFPGGKESHEERVANLRAEIQADSNRTRQAILQYEIGCLLERKLGAESTAVTEYLSAYNLDPGFRPPLFDLIRIFEGRRSWKNLEKLYDAEVRSAVAPGEKASGLVDKGSLLEDHLDRPEEAASAYE